MKRLNLKRFAAVTLAAIVVVSASSMTSLAADSAQTLDIDESQATTQQLNTKQVLANVDTNEAVVNQVKAEIASKSKVTYNNVSQVASLVQVGYYYNQQEGPISITKAKMYNDYGWYKTKGEDVYVVCLSGTDMDAKWNQTTFYITDLLSGFECNNLYTKNSKKAIQKAIPAGSKIMLTGHSLGGMVCQQLAADKELKNQYNIINTVTFGSPLIDNLKREGTVKRLGDVCDVIPYASVNTFTDFAWQVCGLNREDGGYYNTTGNLQTKVTKAHTHSYQRADVWGKYDVVGYKYGSKRLTLDYSTTKFYTSYTKYWLNSYYYDNMDGQAEEAQAEALVPADAPIVEELVEETSSEETTPEGEETLQ